MHANTHIMVCGSITVTVSSVTISMAVSGFDSILVEEFPEYVRDMMQNEEDKLKVEFVVSFLCIYMYVHAEESILRL